MRKLFPLLFIACSFASCSVSKKLGRSAQETVLSAEVLKTAHVGISVYEPATGRYWFNYQGDHYFVPASNTKIPTCYAAMKYLGDSLVGLRYEVNQSSTVHFDASSKSHIDTTYDNVAVGGTADPTFLHPDFLQQPVFDFLKKNDRIFYTGQFVKQFNFFGKGWAWDDYSSDYAVERSELPIYGNAVSFSLQNDTIITQPQYFHTSSIIWQNKRIEEGLDSNFSISRNIDDNNFEVKSSSAKFSSQKVPFKTSFDYRRPFWGKTFIPLLEDTLHKRIGFSAGGTKSFLKYIIHSQPTDSLLKPMMHRSDNFFAEQSLLMVSNEMLGYMNDEKIIDTLLKTDFKGLPQKPRWVDGSGLSRYNLFSPQDFVFILNKMKNEFGMARIKNIFATGGEGTLGSYYKSDSTFLYAKTGTLSGVVALSGFLQTKKGKDLIFSVQVNNHNGSATEVRRAVEKFVQGIRERY